MPSDAPDLIYADGVSKAVLENGVIKLDLVVLTEHNPGVGSKPVTVARPTHRLVLSQEGFAQAMQTFKNLESALKQAASAKQEPTAQTVKSSESAPSHS